MGRGMGQCLRGHTEDRLREGTGIHVAALFSMTWQLLVLRQTPHFSIACVLNTLNHGECGEQIKHMSLGGQQQF